MDTITPAISDQ